MPSFRRRLRGHDDERRRQQCRLLLLQQPGAGRLHGVQHELERLQRHRLQHRFLRRQLIELPHDQWNHRRLRRIVQQLQL